MEWGGGGDRATVEWSGRGVIGLHWNGVGWVGDRATLGWGCQGGR